VLTNGKVLITGGFDRSGLNSAELYDPSTGTWAITGSMNHARWKHTASVLANGNVLVIGGFDQNAINSAESYDPLTESWTNIGGMNDARGEHTVSILTNGKALVTGGSYVGVDLNSTELY
jgi:N-acetylneuraminic acid mutarotase